MGVGSNARLPVSTQNLFAGFRGEYVVRLICDNHLIAHEVVESLCARTGQAGADYGYVGALSLCGGRRFVARHSGAVLRAIQ